LIAAGWRDKSSGVAPDANDADRRHDRRMSSPSAVTVQLTFDAHSDPISGQVRDGGRTFPFVGWLNLMQAVEDALIATRGMSQPTGPHVELVDAVEHGSLT
jgi:hypothetical protein